VPDDLGEDQAAKLSKYDAATLHVLGEYVAAGQHWVQRKEGTPVLTLATVLRAKLDEAVAEARAWDKAGRKVAKPAATGMAPPRADVTETREVKF